MGSSVYGFDSLRLAGIIEHLDEVRAELKSLKADPIEIAPSISQEDFKPTVLIQSDGRLTLALEHLQSEKHDMVYDLDELVMESISEADSECLEGLIVNLSKLLALAATQRATV